MSNGRVSRHKERACRGNVPGLASRIPIAEAVEPHHRQDGVRRSSKSSFWHPYLCMDESIDASIPTVWPPAVLGHYIHEACALLIVDIFVLQSVGCPTYG
jgi:hypothetical protein